MQGVCYCVCQHTTLRGCFFSSVLFLSFSLKEISHFFLSPGIALDYTVGKWISEIIVMLSNGTLFNFQIGAWSEGPTTRD